MATTGIGIDNRRERELREPGIVEEEEGGVTTVLQLICQLHDTTSPFAAVHEEGVISVWGFVWPCLVVSSIAIGR
jgi:hypothetical protein